MIVRSLSGDDEINSLLNTGMETVLDALRSDGLLTQEQVDTFRDHHVVMLVAQGGGLCGWLKRRFGADAKTQVVVARMKL